MLFILCAALVDTGNLYTVCPVNHLAVKIKNPNITVYGWWIIKEKDRYSFEIIKECFKKCKI